MGQTPIAKTGKFRIDFGDEGLTDESDHLESSAWSRQRSTFAQSGFW